MAVCGVVGGNDSACKAVATALRRANSQTPQAKRKEWEGEEKEEEGAGFLALKNSLVLAGRTARRNASPGNSKCSFSFLPVITP